VSLIEAKQQWMTQAIELAIENVRTGTGGPFGALVVKDGVLLASGTNIVTATNDPTAHAEVVAIRAACQRLGSFQLTGCEIYTSCEPCPMCLSAIYWARLDGFFYGASREEAARGGFDDAFIYQEVALPPEQRGIPGTQIPLEENWHPFQEWMASLRKVPY
jgi:guanine deaminase